jgi:hypothetical protein
VFDQNVVLKYGNLGKILALPDDHLARYRFAPGEKLCLAQHGRTTPTCLSTFPPSLALGFHAGRTVNADNIGTSRLPWLPDPHNDVRRVVGG